MLLSSTLLVITSSIEFSNSTQFSSFCFIVNKSQLHCKQILAFPIGIWTGNTTKITEQRTIGTSVWLSNLDQNNITIPLFYIVIFLFYILFLWEQYLCLCDQVFVLDLLKEKTLLKVVIEPLCLKTHPIQKLTLQSNSLNCLIRKTCRIKIYFGWH